MPAPASSTASSARCGGTNASPTATSGTSPVCVRATAPARRSTAKRTTARRSPSRVATAPRQWCCTSSRTGRSASTPGSPTTDAPSLGCCSTRSASSAAPNTPPCSRRRTRSTACTSPARPGVGPDGRLHYGWDERLRLNRGRPLTVSMRPSTTRCTSSRDVRGLRARLVGPPFRGARRRPRAHPDEDGVVGARCRLRAPGRRSSPRSSPTSESRSRSSSPSCSPARRRCSRKRSTRSPTPATRGCCSSAASGPQGAHRGAPVRLRHRALLLGVHRRARALHARRDVRHVRGHPKLITPHELDSPIVAFAVLGVAIVLEAWSLRTARHEATPSRGRIVVALHPHHEEPRAAGRVVRGHGRARRSVLRPDRHQPGRDHRQRPVGRAGQRRHRVCCSG